MMKRNSNHYKDSLNIWIRILDSLWLESKLAKLWAKDQRQKSNNKIMIFQDEEEIRKDKINNISLIAPKPHYIVISVQVEGWTKYVNVWATKPLHLGGVLDIIRKQFQVTFTTKLTRPKMLTDRVTDLTFR